MIVILYMRDKWVISIYILLFQPPSKLTSMITLDKKAAAAAKKRDAAEAAKNQNKKSAGAAVAVAPDSEAVDTYLIGLACDVVFDGAPVTLPDNTQAHSAHISNVSSSLDPSGLVNTGRRMLAFAAAADCDETAGCRLNKSMLKRYFVLLDMFGVLTWV